MNRISRLIKLRGCASSFSAALRHLSSSTELVTSSKDAAGQSPDIILRTMKSATDVTDVLYAVKTHQSVLNSKHLVHAFKTLFQLQKSEVSSMSNREVINSPGFRSLCHTLKLQVRFLDAGELLDTLKTISFLGVPTSSKLVQMILQLLTKEINSLSIQQLLFFDFLVKDFESCPIVEALKIVLPIVLEVNMKVKLDRENVSEMADLLFFASRNNLSQSTINILVDSIMRSRHEISFKVARSVIKSICDMRVPDETYRALLHYCINIVIQNIDDCPFVELDSIISKLASRYSTRNYYFYNESIMDCASNLIHMNDRGLDEAIWILRKANKFGHASVDLLQYASEKLVQDPSHLNKFGSILIFTLVGGCSIAEFKPTEWTILEDLITQCAMQRLNQIELPWIKFALDLASLNSWNHEIIGTIFSASFLEKYLAREYNILDHLQLLKLNQVVKLLHKEYDGVWPPKEYLDKALERITLNHESMQKPLEQALGDSALVLNNVRTREGHLLDHVLLRGPDADTVQPSSNIYFEDLPANCKKIIVLPIVPSSYTANTGCLRGQARQYMETVEAICGPNVVGINTIIWSQLLEREKVNYLMKQIKDKCSTFLPEEAFDQGLFFLDYHHEAAPNLPQPENRHC